MRARFDAWHQGRPGRLEAFWFTVGMVFGGAVITVLERAR